MNLKIVLLIIPIIILISYILLYIWNNWIRPKKVESFANQDDLEWDMISQNLMTDNMFIIKPRVYPPVPLIEMNYGPMNATKFLSPDYIKTKKGTENDEDVYGDGNYFIQWSSDTLRHLYQFQIRRHLHPHHQIHQIHRIHHHPLQIRQRQ